MAEQLIELRLSTIAGNATGRKKTSTLLWLTEQLLQLIEELPVKSEALGTEEFRAQLGRLRANLSGDPQGERFAATAEECSTLCRDYYERASVYLLDREKEFNQVIQLLRSTVTELAHESNTFQSRLNDSSERLNRLGEIQDIRELKQVLAQEVSQLKNAIAERRKQEVESQEWMSQRIQGLQVKLTQAKAEASLDALTGVANRRSFDDEIKCWPARYRTGSQTFALAMLDIDNFKLFNDTYGHQVGDFVLKSAADFIKGNVRSTDFVARYGGEEFAILLADINLRQAEAKMTGLLSKIAASTFEYQIGGQKQQLRFTASCGLAECGALENQWELMMRADGALYEAKKRGKNQVVTTW